MREFTKKERRNIFWGVVALSLCLSLLTSVHTFFCVREFGSLWEQNPLIRYLINISPLFLFISPIFAVAMPWMFRRLMNDTMGLVAAGITFGIVTCDVMAHLSVW